MNSIGELKTDIDDWNMYDSGAPTPCSSDGVVDREHDEHGHCEEACCQHRIGGPLVPTELEVQIGGHVACDTSCQAVQQHGRAVQGSSIACNQPGGGEG